MKRTRSFRLVAAGVAVAVGSAVVVTTTTQPASAANDYQIIVDNLDDALGVILNGIADAAEAYVATNSAEAAADVLFDAMTAAGSALVGGTAQFGQLALGMLIVNQAFGIWPHTIGGWIDDPASIADFLTADDLSAMADALLPFVHDLTFGVTPDIFNPGVLDAVASLIEGRIIGSFQGIETTFVVGDLTIALINALVTLFGGTGFGFNHVAFPALVAGALLAGSLDGFAGTYIQALEDALAPQLTGPLSAVTAPLASLLRGLDLSLSSLPVALPFP